MTIEYIEGVRTVANTIAENGYRSRALPWPGAIYFEDISAESNFELIEIILRTAQQKGTL